MKKDFELLTGLTGPDMLAVLPDYLTLLYDAAEHLEDARLALIRNYSAIADSRQKFHQWINTTFSTKKKRAWKTEIRKLDIEVKNSDKKYSETTKKQAQLQKEINLAERLTKASMIDDKIKTAKSWGVTNLELDRAWMDAVVEAGLLLTKFKHGDHVLWSPLNRTRYRNSVPLVLVVNVEGQTEITFSGSLAGVTAYFIPNATEAWQMINESGTSPERSDIPEGSTPNDLLPDDMLVDHELPYLIEKGREYHG